MNRSALNNSAFLSRTTEVIKSNLKNEQFGVSLLAREMGMSRSNLHRKIKAETGISVSQFISRVRLAHAYELLHESGVTVSEAAYESGFHSVTYFSTCFHEFYGYPPGKVAGNALLAGEPAGTPAENNRNSSKNNKRRVLFLSLLVLPVFFTAVLIILVDAPLPSLAGDPVSIAVLPVESGPADSSGQTMVYALMFQLIKNLSEVENFDVRMVNTRLPDGQFMHAEADNARNADYIVESKAGSRDEIEIKLKNTSSGNFVISESFVAGNDIFHPAAQMAYEIAASINGNLSDDKKETFEKAPSAIPNALLNYQLGLNYKFIAGQVTDPERGENLLKAKNHFEEAVKLDSSFTEALVELGHLYINNLYYAAGTMQQADHCLEKGHQLVRKALGLNRENKGALNLLGRYYLRKGSDEQAERIFAGLSYDAASGYEEFVNEFDVSVHYQDYCNAVQNFFYFVRNKPPDMLTPKYMLYNVALVFSDTGFPEVAREYARQLLAGYSDSVQYCSLMGTVEMRAGNYPEAVEQHLKTGGEEAFSSASHHFFMFNYLVMDDLANAARHLEKWEAAKPGELRYPSQYYIAGMICRLTGREEKAQTYFKAAEKNLLEAVSRKTRRSQIYVEQFYLAGVCLELGKTDKAIQYLSLLNDRKTIPHWIILGFETWPPLAGRRNMPEIEAIYQNLRVKYNREHDRMGNVLVKEGLIKKFAQLTKPPE